MFPSLFRTFLRSEAIFNSGSMTRDSIPPLAVTGVGSLPHADATDAMNFVARHASRVPFFPQLPRRSRWEGMIDQALRPLSKILQRDRFPHWRLPVKERTHFARSLESVAPEFDRESAAGFFSLEEWIRAGRLSDATIVKTQIVGPLTLANCIRLGDDPILSHSTELRQLARYLARHVAWQITRLGQWGGRVLMTLDEPALSSKMLLSAKAPTSSLTDVVQMVVDAIHHAGGLAGLHCCAPFVPELIQPLRVDMLSFDALLPIDEPRFGELARAVLQRQGWLAFGLVPTTEMDLEDSALVARWRSLAASAGEVDWVRRHSLVTTTCGLGLASERFAQAALDRCHRVAAKIAEV